MQGPVPLPWAVLYEFMRQNYIWCMVAFGPRSAPAVPAGAGLRAQRNTASGHAWRQPERAKAPVCQTFPGGL